MYTSIKYPNQLNRIDAKYWDFEKEIKAFRLEFPAIHNRRMEWQIKAPLFVKTFYNFLLNQGKIPGQAEMWDEYRNGNSTWFSDAKLIADEENGLRARLYRAYPSLVRDLHFGKYLEYRMAEYEVVYNLQLDIEFGIDLLLVNSTGSATGLCLYTDTERAHIGRKKKESRTTALEKINYLALPVDLSGSKKCGDFKLYGKREMLKIIRLLP